MFFILKTHRGSVWDPKVLGWIPNDFDGSAILLDRTDSQADSLTPSWKKIPAMPCLQ